MRTTQIDPQQNVQSASLAVEGIFQECFPGSWSWMRHLRLSAKGTSALFPELPSLFFPSPSGIYRAEENAGFFFFFLTPLAFRMEGDKR